MKNKLMLSLLITFLITGCASVEKKHLAGNNDSSITKQQLALSYELNKNLSSEHFGLLELSFYNRQSAWVNIKNIELIIKDEDLQNTVKLTSGLEFENWRKAMTKKVAIQDYNTSVVLSSIMVGGAIAASTSNNNKVTDTANIAAGLAATSQTVHLFSNAKDSIESTAMFPQSHLLATPDVVPPTLFLDKWLLLDTSGVSPENYLGYIDLKVTYEDDSEDLFSLNLINFNQVKHLSKWQKNKLKRLRSGTVTKSS